MTSSTTASDPAQLYLPDDILSWAIQICKDGPQRKDQIHAYGWGQRTGSALVVMGFVLARTAQEASKVVEARFTGLEPDSQPFQVLVQLTAGPKGPILACFDTHSPPSFASQAEAVRPVILYAPLQQLEILSLEPLQLDFDPRAKPSVNTLSSPSCSVPMGLAAAVTTINGSRLALQVWQQPHRRRAQFSGGLRRIGLGLSSTIHAGLSLLLSILTFHMPLVGSFADVSCFGRQLETRLSQALSLVPTFSSFRRDLHAPRTPEAQYVAAHAAYIRFFNLLWLLANDLIIGVALAAVARDNAVPIRALVTDLVEVHVLAYLRELLQWLNSWPLGIKLHSEVASVICRAFLLLSRVWEDAVLKPVLPHLPVRLIGCAGFLGASSLLALAADLFAILTLPFWACYAVAAVVYRWNLRSLAALYNAFRGRKYNPARDRVEPASYDVNALLLGTILFVALSFVFPTLAAFYGAFASSRLFILAVEAALLTAIAALNAFPLFALLLRIKAPGRLPGGVQMNVCSEERHWPRPHLHLRSQPLSFGHVISSLSSVFAHFSPAEVLAVLARLSTGREIVWSSRSASSAESRGS